MKNFDTRTYNVSDFREWQNSGLLNISPDFQRRAVWSEKAKSYLIDTIIRGKPIPKILISQELKGSRNVRVVVDGQQRLRSILEFIDGDFRISRAHNDEFAGFTFDRLPMSVQNDYLKYELGVDLLFDMSYEDILDIFTRINSYTVPLNDQEKYNATYLGYFKQTVYKYGLIYVKYFIEGGIVTKAAVTRMAEAELAADLMMSLLGGVQTNKNVSRYYKEYDDEPGDLSKTATQFDTIMSYIGEIYGPDELTQTNWSRVHLFYTLFTSLGHMLFTLQNLDPGVRRDITPASVGKIRVRLDEVSSRYDEYTAHLDSTSVPLEYRTFIDQSRRRTTDTAARVGRANFICNQMKIALD